MKPQIQTKDIKVKESTQKVVIYIDSLTTKVDTKTLAKTLSVLETDIQIVTKKEPLYITVHPSAVFNPSIDVEITNPQEGQVLIYDGTQFINAELYPNVGIEVDNPQIGDILTYDGINFTNEPLDIGFDVTVTSPQEGDTLIYSGGSFINTTAGESMIYTKRLDVISDTLMYKGEAAVGAVENASVWRIRRITFGLDGDVTEEWANGNTNFTNKWSDRLILTYS